jgi:hypothetical protein
VLKSVVSDIPVICSEAINVNVTTQGNCHKMSASRREYCDANMFSEKKIFG